MDSAVTPPNLSGSFKLYSASVQKENFSADLMVLEATFSTGQNAANSKVDFQDLYKSLSVTAKNIVDKINELLKTRLPDGVQSLKPSEVTPQATAETIVNGATSLFTAFQKQHADMEPEELLNSFMEQVRSGVQRGYDDAFTTLKGLGAFDVDGVQAGVERTKSLIDEKLERFEAHMRKTLGIDQVTPEEDLSELTNESILQQAGAATLHAVA